MSDGHQDGSSSVNHLTNLSQPTKNADIPNVESTGKNHFRIASANPTTQTNLDKLRQLRRMRNKHRILSGSPNQTQQLQSPSAGVKANEELAPDQT